MLTMGCCHESLISALVDIIKRVKTFTPHPHIPSGLGMLVGLHEQEEGRPGSPVSITTAGTLAPGQVPVVTDELLHRPKAHGVHWKFIFVSDYVQKMAASADKALPSGTPGIVRRKK